MFVSLDGAGDGSELTTGALGSRRYRVTYRGPGGHSYGSFGLVNPAYALASAMSRLARTPCIRDSPYDVQCRGHRRRDIGKRDPE